MLAKLKVKEKEHEYTRAMRILRLIAQAENLWTLQTTVRRILHKRNSSVPDHQVISFYSSLEQKMLLNHRVSI